MSEREISLPDFFINKDTRPKVKPNTWKDMNNIKVMCEYIGKIYNFEKDDDWYGIKNEHFNNNNGAGLLTMFRGSASLLIFKIFPEKNLNIWKFVVTPTLQKSTEQTQEKHFVSLDTQEEHFLSLVDTMLQEHEKKYKTLPSRQWWEKTNTPNIISLSKRLKSKGVIDYSWGDLLKKLNASRNNIQYVSKSDGLKKHRVCIDNKDKIKEVLIKIYDKYGIYALRSKNLDRNHSEEFSKLGSGISKLLRPKEFKYRYQFNNSYDMPDEFICLHLLKGTISKEEFVKSCKKVNPYCCNREELIELHIKPAYEKIIEKNNISLLTYEVFQNEGYTGVVTRTKQFGISIDSLRQILGLSRGNKCITYDGKLLDSAGEVFLYNLIKTYSKEEVEIYINVKYKHIDQEIAETLQMTCNKGYDIDYTFKIKGLIIHCELWGYWKDSDQNRSHDYLTRKSIKLRFWELYKEKYPNTKVVFVGINNGFGILKDSEFEASIIKALSPYMEFDMNKKPNRSQLLTIEKTRGLLLEEGRQLQIANGGTLPPCSVKSGCQEVRNLFQRVNRSTLFKTEDGQSNWDNFKKELGVKVRPTDDEIKRNVIEFINNSQTNDITISYIQEKLDEKYDNFCKNWHGGNFTNYLDCIKKFAESNNIVINKKFKMKIDKKYGYNIEKYIGYGREFVKSLPSSQNSINQEDWKNWGIKNRKKDKMINERPWRSKNCKWSNFKEFMNEVYKKYPNLRKVNY